MKALLLAALAVTPGVAAASIEIPGAPTDPSPDTFDSTVVSTIVHGDDTITVTLSAQPRTPADPPVRILGAGSYGAMEGASAPGLATWDFSLSATIDGPGTLADYRLVLSYDHDPGVGTPLAEHGAWDISMWAHNNGADLSDLRLLEVTENLGADFLSTTDFGVVAPPDVAFDPFAAGEYTFFLQVFAPFIGGWKIDTATMQVVLMPEPTTAVMWVGLAGAASLTGRRRRVA